MNRTRRTLLAALAALPVATTRAVTSGISEIELVTPTPPGTQPDQIARWLAEPLARESGARVVVRNRPGASGAIAADAVLATAAPGTALLLVGGLDHVAYSHLGSGRRPLDPFRDFVPVGAVSRDAWVVVATPGLVADLRGLAQAAAARGALDYASFGEGSTSHLLAARLVKAVGIEAQHVPYKESFLPDLMTGRVQFAVAPVPAMLGPLRERMAAPLAVLDRARLPVLPEVPAIAEVGYPDQVFQGGLFLFAPAALSGAAPAMNRWLVAALNDPVVVERYRAAGIDTTPLNLAQTRDSVAQRLILVDGMRAAVFGKPR